MDEIENLSKEKNTEEEKQRFRDKTYPKIVSFALNRYALENVAFGDIQKGDKIPFENYVDKLNISYYQPEKYRKQIAGIAINSREKICIDKTDAMCAMFFHRVNLLWSAACQIVPTGDNDFYPNDFDRNLARVTFDLLPLFLNIMKVRVDCKYVYQPKKYDKWPSDLIYFRTAKFLLGIYLNKIQPLDCVDKYFSDISELPDYLRRMLMKWNQNYHLKGITADSMLYKLAILYTLDFESEKHQFIFHKKIEKWEELNKEKIEKV